MMLYSNLKGFENFMNKIKECPKNLAKYTDYAMKNLVSMLNFIKNYII